MNTIRLAFNLFAVLALTTGAPAAFAESAAPSPHTVVKEDFSRAGFAATVAALKTQFSADGWNIVSEIDLGARLAKKNVNLPGGLTIIEMTSGGNTIPLLKNEDTRYVAGLMPCSVSVYGMDDGRVVVSRMNADALAGIMEPRVGNVLKQSASKLDASIAAALSKVGD